MTLPPQYTFWRLVCWLAAKQLSDPCMFKETLYSDSKFRLEIARTGL